MESLKDESNLVSDIMRQSTTLSNKISLISSDCLYSGDKLERFSYVSFWHLLVR
jgi:hypothetical protein